MDYRYIPFYVQGNAIPGVYYSQLGMENDRDIEYVKEMYPQTINRLQELVEQESNRQEFAGSMMFDEYPDKEQVVLLAAQVFDRCKECDSLFGRNPNLKDFIQVILCNEMCKRRIRHHNRLRRFQFFN